MQLLLGDALTTLRTLPSQSVQTCVTSPPYFGLRDYGMRDQIGMEETPEAFIQKLVAVFREVRRVLRIDGTLWLNLGDSYAVGGKGVLAAGTSTGGKNQHANLSSQVARFAKAETPGLKSKNLVGIPWRVAFALQADGWFLRQDIIWHKPNPMPESVTDRCTKAHEYVFLLSKWPSYYYDREAIKEKAVSPGSVHVHKEGNKTSSLAGARLHATKPQRSIVTGEWRNRRSVWTVTTKPYRGAHFATFPPDLIEPCILAGAPEGGVVLDPFMGSGTTAFVARKHNREFIGIELNPEYMQLAKARIAAAKVQPTLAL